MRAGPVAAAERGEDGGRAPLLAVEGGIVDDGNLPAVAAAAGEDSGGEDADVHDSDIGGAAGVQHAGEVVPLPGGGHGSPGARVEHVAIDLRGVEPPAGDDPADGGGLAEGGHADEPDESLRAQPVERVGDVSQDPVRRDMARIGRGGDGVVQLQDVHRIAAQALQAAGQAAFDLAGGVGERGRVEARLGGDVRRAVETPQQPAERPFRLPIAVGRRGVDQVNPRLQRAGERGAAGVLVAVDEDAAHPAAAEGEFGHLQSGAAQAAAAQGHSPSSVHSA